MTKIPKARLPWPRELPGRPAPRAVDDVSDFPRPEGPPSLPLVGELRGVVEPARLLAASPWLAKAPKGHRETVIDLPGWKAPEASNLALRTYLRSIGYSAKPWGLGTNRGSPEQDAERLVSVLSDEDGPPVALIGWSLGGVIAREVARAVPERVSCVVTFGSPAVGGPTYTLGASAFGTEECLRVEALARQLDSDRPIQVPITAIFTKRDHVVDWRACIDHASPHVRHVEVGATHLSLGLDPDVWWAVAMALHAGFGNSSAVD